MPSTNPSAVELSSCASREPKTTALLFASGKMVCTGAKSEDDARTAARKFAKVVQKLGLSATFKEFAIHNIVGSCSVNFPIRLEAMADSHRSFAMFEPELFPGLRYRMLSPKVTLMVFVSGKVVLTGAKHRTDIYNAFENIYPILQNYRKGGAPAAAPLAALLPPAAPAANDGAGPSGAYKVETENEEDVLKLPPPTPAHPGLPPPTPAHPGLLPQHTVAMELPPPTPMHASLH